MRLIPPIQGFDYTKLPYPDLVARFNAIPRWQSELLGQSAGGHPIYGYQLGDTIAKPVIYMEANIHGLHEWRTCYWMSEFMRILSEPHRSSAHETIVEDLTARYAFYVIPALNPDGYIANDYRNSNGVNLNRNCDFMWENGSSDPNHIHYRGPAPFSEPETQIIRDQVTTLKPYAFIDTHSWGGYDTLTALDPQNAGLRYASRDMLTATKISLGAGGSSGFAPTLTVDAGTAQNWAATVTSRSGRAVLAFLIESGDQATEQEQARMGMNGLLHYCLTVDRILTSGNIL